MREPWRKRFLIMIVPWQDISSETLISLIEEYVSRDGTDYGDYEVPLATKVDQVRNLLKQELAVIWFDEATEAISIFTKEQLKEHGLN